MIPSETRHFLRNKLNIAQGVLKDTAAGYSLTAVELIDAVQALEQIVELLSIEESIDALLASPPELLLGEFLERAIDRLKQYSDASLQISHAEQIAIQRSCDPEVLRACLLGVLYFADTAVSGAGARAVNITYGKNFIRVSRAGLPHGQGAETKDVIAQITENSSVGVALRQCMRLCSNNCVTGKMYGTQLVEISFQF